jgi:hypothetical protein
MVLTWKLATPALAAGVKAAGAREAVGPSRCRRMAAVIFRGGGVNEAARFDMTDAASSWSESTREMHMRWEEEPSLESK